MRADAGRPVNTDGVPMEGGGRVLGRSVRQGDMV